MTEEEASARAMAALLSSPVRIEVHGSIWVYPERGYPLYDACYSWSETRALLRKIAKDQSIKK